MADRVHPRDSPPATTETTNTSLNNSTEPPSKSTLPGPERSVPPPPSTYVIQVPKDQIYRYPPPENGHHYQNLTRRKPRRSCCCRCLSWTLGLLFLLLVVLAVAAGVFYLVFRPESPNYTVDQIAIRGLNLTSSSPVSPEFDVTIRAQNPNDKIGIYYERGSSVNVFYSDVNICNGVLPAFYQPSNNLTVFRTALRGSNIILANGVRTGLVNAQRQREVPFNLNLKAPVKIKVGSVKTWTITVKVKCDVMVNGLTTASEIVSRNCDYSVKLW